MDAERRRVLTVAVAAAGGCGNGAPSRPFDAGFRPAADANSLVCPGVADGPGMGYCNARGDGVRVRVLGAARLEAGQVLLHDIDGDAAVFVARDARGLYALSAVCTHQCCIVSLCGGRDPLCLHTVDDPGPGLVTASAVLAAMGPAFHCICHNSAYDAAGVVLSGPSIRPLPSLSACIDGDDVMVDTSRVVPADTRQ